MKRFLVMLMVALFSAVMVAPDADARRLGGGRSFGKQSDLMKRDAARPPAQSGQQSAAPPASGAAARATGGRSWMGPIAGIAAGLGLAALASHLGLGEEFGTIILMALVFFAVLVAVRMFMARRNGAPGQRSAYAGAGAGHGGPRGTGPAAQPWAARSGPGAVLPGRHAPARQRAALQQRARQRQRPPRRRIFRPTSIPTASSTPPRSTSFACKLRSTTTGRTTCASSLRRRCSPS